MSKVNSLRVDVKTNISRMGKDPIPTYTVGAKDLPTLQACIADRDSRIEAGMHPFGFGKNHLPHAHELIVDQWETWDDKGVTFYWRYSPQGDKE